jgi:hypothetical protein
MDHVDDDGHPWGSFHIVRPRSPIVFPATAKRIPCRDLVEENWRLQRELESCRRQLQDARSQSSNEMEVRYLDMKKSAQIVTVNLQASELQLEAATIDNMMIKVNEQQAEDNTRRLERKIEQAQEMPGGRKAKLSNSTSGSIKWKINIEHFTS